MRLRIQTGVELSTPSNELRKRNLVTELYNTGRFKGVAYNELKRNPIRSYITAALYKQRLPHSKELVEDCYNEAFMQLSLMPAEKFLKMYDATPGKVISVVLKIVALKCLAIDPRYGNPKHSLIQGIKFASALTNTDYHTLSDTVLNNDNNDKTNGSAIGRYIFSECFQSHNSLIASLSTTQEDYSPFKTQYGFEVEDIIEQLSEAEQATFYAMLDKQPRGKVSAAKKAERDALTLKLISIKQSLTN